MKEKILKVAMEMSDDALRVLGVAFKDVDSVIVPEEMEKERMVPQNLVL